MEQGTFFKVKILILKVTVTPKKNNFLLQSLCFF